MDHCFLLNTVIVLQYKGDAQIKLLGKKDTINIYGIFCVNIYCFTFVYISTSTSACSLGDIQNEPKFVDILIFFFSYQSHTILTDIHILRTINATYSGDLMIFPAVSQ